MRTRSQGFAVAALLLCFVLVSSSIWALPVQRPAPAPTQEISLVRGFLDWVLSLFERYQAPHKSPSPELVHLQAPEGSQMDPNGNH